jgi:hypothetical protein
VSPVRAEGFEPPSRFRHRDLNPAKAILSGRLECGAVPLSRTFVGAPSVWSLPVPPYVAILGCKMVAVAAALRKRTGVAAGIDLAAIYEATTPGREGS